MTRLRSRLSLDCSFVKFIKLSLIKLSSYVYIVEVWARREGERDGPMGWKGGRA